MNFLSLDLSVVENPRPLPLRRSSLVPVFEVNNTHRFTSSFSDFKTRYTAVSSTNLRTQMAEYYALETDDGLTMNLGTNPMLQYGLEAIQKHGAIKGGFLAAYRVCRCNPFSKGGYDPVP